jgi:hypothetical protein
MAPMTAKERREMERRSKLREARLRRKYREVHGKVVDFITNTVDDGTLYSQSISRTGQVFASAMPATCSPLELNSAIGRTEISTSSANT